MKSSIPDLLYDLENQFYERARLMQDLQEENADLKKENKQLQKKIIQLEKKLAKKGA